MFKGLTNFVDLGASGRYAQIGGHRKKDGALAPSMVVGGGLLKGGAKQAEPDGLWIFSWEKEDGKRIYVRAVRRPND